MDADAQAVSLISNDPRVGSCDSIKSAASSPIAAVLTQALAQAPQQLRQLEPLLRQLHPYLQAAKANGLKAREVLDPYYDEEGPAIATGLVLLLFGKRFALTIACYQAFKLCGARLITKSWEELKESYRENRLALRRDPEAKELFDLRDEAGGEDAIRDLLACLRDVSVAQTEGEQTMCRRKVVLLMRCVDAEKVREAGWALCTGSMAVLATLRSRALYAASLGAAVGQRASDALVPLAGPRLRGSFPQHQQRLVDLALQVGPRAFGVLAGLVLSRTVCAFDAAQQGSGLLLAAFLRLAQRKQWDVAALTEEQQYKAAWILALVGFVWQIRPGARLPVALILPLTPVYIVEWLLTLLAVH